MYTYIHIQWKVYVLFLMAIMNTPTKPRLDLISSIIRNAQKYLARNERSIFPLLFPDTSIRMMWGLFIRLFTFLLHDSFMYIKTIENANIFFYFCCINFSTTRGDAYCYTRQWLRRHKYAWAFLWQAHALGNPFICAWEDNGSSKNVTVLHDIPRLDACLQEWTYIPAWVSKNIHDKWAM